MNTCHVFGARRGHLEDVIDKVPSVSAINPFQPKLLVALNLPHTCSDRHSFCQYSRSGTSGKEGKKKKKRVHLTLR